MAKINQKRIILFPKKSSGFDFDFFEDFISNLKLEGLPGGDHHRNLRSDEAKTEGIFISIGRAETI